MADLPAHISGYETLEPPTLDSNITAPTSFPPLPSSVSQRRTRSPPAPTIYLTGFRCHVSDQEYNYARETTGDIQPYWFEESYNAAGFAEGVRRRARRDMGPNEDVIAIIDLVDDGEDTDSDQSESSSLVREEQWKQIEAERKRLEKEMKKLKSSEMGQRLVSGALDLLDFVNETEGTGSSSVSHDSSTFAEPQPAPAVAEFSESSQQPPHEPNTTSSMTRYSGLAEEDPWLPSAPTRPRAPTPPSLRSLATTATNTDAQSTSSTGYISQPFSSPSATTAQADIPLLPTPENSGLVRGVGTLERQTPGNSGLVQDFGTLERARALRATRSRFFGCCGRRRKDK